MTPEELNKDIEKYHKLEEEKSVYGKRIILSLFNLIKI